MEERWSRANYLRPLAALDHSRGRNFLDSWTLATTAGHELLPSRDCEPCIGLGKKRMGGEIAFSGGWGGWGSRRGWRASISRGPIHGRIFANRIVYFDLQDSLSAAGLRPRRGGSVLRDFDGEFMARASSLLGLHKYEQVDQASDLVSRTTNSVHRRRSGSLAS